MDIDKVKEFIRWAKIKKDLETELKLCKEKMLPIEDELLEYFQEMGVNNIKVDGTTVYLHRQIWARPIDGDRNVACDILEKIGLSELVERTFNVHRLSAVVREWEEEGTPIPAEFKDKINVEEVFHVKARGV